MQDPLQTAAAVLAVIEALIESGAADADERLTLVQQANRAGLDLFVIDATLRLRERLRVIAAAADAATSRRVARRECVTDDGY
jgi:hypothetical protein